MKKILLLSMCLILTIAVRAVTFEIGVLRFMDQNPDPTTVAVMQINAQTTIGDIEIPSEVSFEGKNICRDTYSIYGFRLVC